MNPFSQTTEDRNLDKYLDTAGEALPAGIPQKGDIHGEPLACQNTHANAGGKIRQGTPRETRAYFDARFSSMRS